MAETYLKSTLTAKHGTLKTPLNFMDRLAFLVLHYLSGPIFGLRQKLIVVDQKPNLPESLVALFFLGWIEVFWLEAVDQSPIIAFAIILILLPILLYAFTKIAQQVLEYRAYLSSAGVALTWTLLLRNHPVVLGAILVFFIIQSVRRLRLYKSSNLFWTQAMYDSYAVLPAAMIERRYEGRFFDVDKILHQLFDENLPLTSGDWLNGATWSVLDKHRLEHARTIVNSLIETCPLSSAAWRNLGIIDFHLGSMLWSESSFRRALELDPSDALSHLALGQILLNSSVRYEAEDHFLHALQLSPDSDYIRLKYLSLAYDLGHIVEFDRENANFQSRNMIVVTADMLKGAPNGQT